jgi:type IV pilus assembly protein PilM
VDEEVAAEEMMPAGAEEEEPSPEDAVPVPAAAIEPEPLVEDPPVSPTPAPDPPLVVPPPVAAVPVVAAAQPGIHPPVPASQLAPLPPEGVEKPKSSLLRRDLSFRRGSKKAAPEAPEESRERDGRRPFWRRDLSPRGNAKEQRAPEPGPVPAPAPALEASAHRRKRKRESGRGTQRHKRLVGLKVGASQIAAAQVVNNGAPSLVQVARAPLEPGIVASGELREPDALAEALKEFFARNRLPKRSVRLGIATNRIGVRSFELGGIEDPKQLANAIRFRAQDALPIPIEEAVLDYQVLSEGVDEEGQPTRRVLLVVAYRELIDRYVHACRKAGIKLVGIDLEAFALLRALEAPPEDDARAESATVAVAVGSDRSTFAVSDGRVCEFTRVLDWGGFLLNVAVARALDIAPSEAETIKRSLSLADSVVPDGLSTEQAEQAREAIRRQVTSFARELVSSLQFYQNQPGSLSIATIAVTGGTAHLGGFAAELERLIGVGVRVGDPLVRVRVGKKVRADEQAGSLAIAIGLGIED